MPGIDEAGPATLRSHRNAPWDIVWAHKSLLNERLRPSKLLYGAHSGVHLKIGPHLPTVRVEGPGGCSVRLGGVAGDCGSGKQGILQKLSTSWRFTQKLPANFAYRATLVNMLKV